MTLYLNDVPDAPTITFTMPAEPSHKGHAWLTAVMQSAEMYWPGVRAGHVAVEAIVNDDDPDWYRVTITIEIHEPATDGGQQ